MPLYERHGQSFSGLYYVWSDMKARCNNVKHAAYSRYGGRGITVCTDWTADFAAFELWARSNGYKPGLLLDRKDNDEGYNPQNCRFVSRKESQNNRRNTVFVTAFGVRKPLTDWVNDPRCSIDRVALSRRIKAKWPAELAITKPSNRKPKEN